MILRLFSRCKCLEQQLHQHTGVYPNDGQTEVDLCISQIADRNQIIQHMVSRSDTIINACFPHNADTSDKLMHTVNCYRAAMKLLCKHCKLRPDERNGKFSRFGG